MSEGSQSQDIGSSQSSRIVGDQSRRPRGHLESGRRRPVRGRGKSKASGNQREGGRQDHDLVGGRSEVLSAHNMVRATCLGPSGSGLHQQWEEQPVSNGRAGEETTQGDDGSGGHLAKSSSV